MTGGIGELDISADGSRIVVAQKISTDGQGNAYWHPYMHIGPSVGLGRPCARHDHRRPLRGMSSDGSRVFYSTKDKLRRSDTDTSADVYEAEVRWPVRSRRS